MPSNYISYYPSLSADGRYVAFMSLSSNIVADDANGGWDIFVHDRQTSVTTLVSVDSSNMQGNSDTLWPTISADGRYVAFMSYANNLVADDTNDTNDIFVHDRDTGTTTRVSVNSAGAEANGNSDWPAISADGKHVAFLSNASNLVADDTNNTGDIFVHDRQTGAVSRVSVASNGAQSNQYSTTPSISTDGRFVAFMSSADDLVDSSNNGSSQMYLRDRIGQTANINTTIAIDIAPTNDAPTTETPIADQDAVEGQNFSFQVAEDTFADVDLGDTLGYSATLADGSPLPSWLKFDGSTRSFTSTPDDDAVGTITVKVTATDTAGATTDATFDLAVSNVNDAPSFVSTEVKVGIKGKTYTYTIVVKDQDANSTLQLNASTLPAWLTFTDNGDGTATLTGTPTEDEIGSHDVVLTLTDGMETTTQAFAIVVEAAPRPYVVRMPISAQSNSLDDPR